MEGIKKITVAGAGAMGAGIAQVAASAGHEVYLYDTRTDAIHKAIQGIYSSLDKLTEKGKVSSVKAEEIKKLIHPAPALEDIKGTELFIEAIIENLPIKKELFAAVEALLDTSAILASNTSSLSVTAIAAACKHPERVVGLHFFNPATLMPLVEIIPAVQTNSELPQVCVDLMKRWGKIPVVAKDTPGFIVNRVARPFYGEALRILEEGIADIPTIDYAIKTFGGFRMGPFELMDLIGNDINYTVTETVWSQMYFDPRYKPSLIQKKMMEANRFGRKSGQGYYSYAEGAVHPSANTDEVLCRGIFERVLVMLINEAAEACYLKIASVEELDLAMTKGVNYPKGLLKWSDELGAAYVLSSLSKLYELYCEDRYRPSVLLRKLAISGTGFY